MVNWLKEGITPSHFQLQPPMPAILCDNVINSSSSTADSVSAPSNSNFESESARLNKSSNLDFSMVPDVDGHMITLIYFLFRLLESVLAIIGNSLTIYVCANYRNMRTKTNLLITSLAMGDLLSGLDTPLYITAELRFQHKDGHFLCVAAEFVDLLGGFGNTFSITLLAYDRLMAIKYPLHYNSHTPHQVLKLLVIVWLYILAFLIALFIFGQEPGYKYPICFFKANLTWWAHDVVIYGHVLLLSMLTCIFYGNVWHSLGQRTALRTTKQQFTNPSLKYSEARRRLHVRAMRMLGLVVGVYFTLAIPITLGSFCGLLNASMSVQQHMLFRICWSIWYVNSFVNPFLYAWTNSCFRQALQLQVDVLMTALRTLLGYHTTPEQEAHQTQLLEQLNKSTNSPSGHGANNALMPHGCDDVNRTRSPTSQLICQDNDQTFAVVTSV